MFRTLFIIIAIALAVWLIRQMLNNRSNTPKRPSAEVKKIVQCKACGVYIPEDQATKEGDDTFCSVQHLEEWKNRR